MPLKKRGLGKGLDAIFAENTAESTEGAVNVKISEIEPNREQPRKEFDSEALSELADSISQHGGLQPLLLRPLLKKGEKIPFWRLAVIELPSEVVMVLGYFGYKALILGKGLSAAASIPNNLVQATIGIVLSVLLYTALSKVPEIHKAFWKGE